MQKLVLFLILILTASPAFAVDLFEVPEGPDGCYQLMGTGEFSVVICIRGSLEAERNSPTNAYIATIDFNRVRVLTCQRITAVDVDSNEGIFTLADTSEIRFQPSVIEDETEFGYFTFARKRVNYMRLDASEAQPLWLKIDRSRLCVN